MSSARLSKSLRLDLAHWLAPPDHTSAQPIFGVRAFCGVRAFIPALALPKDGSTRRFDGRDTSGASVSRLLALGVMPACLNAIAATI
ncbi:MAG: hypothetical protein ABI557_20555, partial [Aureliella sp.]